MRSFLLLLGCCLCFGLGAQPEDDVWHYGFKIGAGQHQLSDVRTTIIPAGFDESSFSTTDVSQLGYTVGAMFYHRFYRSLFAIQPEVNFLTRGSRFEYVDNRDLEYAIDFNYQFVTVGSLVKVYPFGGFHFGLGAQAAFNVASDRIEYTSNMPELGPDLQIQQSLREVLFGRNDLQGIGQVGYDFPFGLSFEARYLVGLNDVVETGANNFNFSDTTNRSSGFVVTVGWLIEFPN